MVTTNGEYKDVVCLSQRFIDWERKLNLSSFPGKHMVLKKPILGLMNTDVFLIYSTIHFWKKKIK
jgi:hypothetical protein